MISSLPKTLKCENRVIEVKKLKYGELRSRKIISRSNTKPTIKYPSWKARRMLHCESRNELNVFYLLDADPSIDFFSEQPLKIVYLEDGERKLHYPDVLVIRKNSFELLEVKEDLSKEPPSLFKRTQILKEGLQTFGYRYRLVCGRKVKEDNIKLSNAKYLLLHGRVKTNVIDYERTRRFFIENKTAYWQSFLYEKETKNNLGILCNLILKGLICYDESLLIGASTQIYWNDKVGVQT